MLDASHPIIRTAKGFLPRAFVVGDSFGDSLPHPKKVPPAERPKLIALARQQSTNACLTELLLLAGLSETASIKRNQTGDRHWPSGFAGSITHKGSVVLAVMGSLSDTPGIGIDLERQGGADLTTIEDLIGHDSIPPLADEAQARLVAFSAKEAVFKAQFPITQLRLKFGDVKLSWSDPTGDEFQAVASCDSCPTIFVHCAIATPWIISVATILP
jgi:4'-phosphopantetheinyl transferase EntD